MLVSNIKIFKPSPHYIRVNVIHLLFHIISAEGSLKICAGLTAGAERGCFQNESIPGGITGSVLCTKNWFNHTKKRLFTIWWTIFLAFEHAQWFMRLIKTCQSYLLYLYYVTYIKHWPKIYCVSVI